LRVLSKAAVIFDMAKAERRTNPVVLRQGMTIGSVSAETDEEFLLSCFIQYLAVDECSRVQSPGMILQGEGRD
jgi:hypothetical protein